MKSELLGMALWRDAVDQLPMGVLLLDSHGTLVGWNLWMADKCRISQHDAIGKTLPDLFPGFQHPRFALALEEVFASGSPQLLSHALNKYVIPVKIEITNPYGLEWMQQKVQIAALQPAQGPPLALVTIMDVTETALQAKALIAAAKTLQETSNRDPLTNMYNRRFMLSWLKQELKMAQRHAYPVACMMLDIDHFKRINDTFGHEVGDKVLLGFVQVLGEHVRDSDIFVRYGGEEFIVLLPRCTLAMGLERAQVMVEALRKASLGPLQPGEVTCSIGVASSDPGLADQRDVMLQAADEQLYVAKRTGRDRVCPVSP